MKERPILFSGPMIRAILERRKTQTRRIVKPQFFRLFGSGVSYHDPDYYSIHVDIKNQDGTWKWLRCPYGKPGDSLWVRETYLPDPPMDDTWDYYLYNDSGGQLNLEALPDRFKKPDHCVYRASWDGGELRWRPSIHMPRWASRITLEITGVRVERLQDISGADAVAEGVTVYSGDDLKRYDAAIGGARVASVGIENAAVKLFAELWDSINAGRGYSFESNPWVWVINFNRIESETN